VLLVSGFAAASKREAEREGIPLLSKPYTLNDLAAKLRDTIGCNAATRTAKQQSPRP
jgi:hypothetical protein